MQKRKLGKRNLEGSALGLGCMCGVVSKVQAWRSTSHQAGGFTMFPSHNPSLASNSLSPIPKNRQDAIHETC